MQYLDDKTLLIEFQKNNIEAFEKFFRTLQPQLVSFAHKFLDDWEISRDIVQEIFIAFWENKEKTDINVSIRAYMYASVKNKCSNYIKHKIVEHNYSDKTIADFKQLEINFYSSSEEPFRILSEKELNNKIEQIVSSLPEQCRITFELSRYKGLKNSEIAQKMDLSVRTVETQIYRALKTLKESLKDYLTLF